MKSFEAHVLPSSEYFSFVPSANAYQYLLYPLLCGVFAYEGGYQITRDSFDSFLLEVILEGEVTLEVKDETISAGKNDVILIDCYERHHYHSDTGWKAAWMHFDGASARGYYNMIRKANGIVFATPYCSLVRRTIMDLFHQCRRKEPLDEAETALSLTSVLTALAEASDQGRPVKPAEKSIERMLVNINAGIDSPPTTREMAEMAGLSQYHFIRVFSEMMGVTPKQYVLTLRMNHAKYLLASGNHDLSEIARLTGYKSKSAFCTAFHNVCHMTPKEYVSRESG